MKRSSIRMHMALFATALALAGPVAAEDGHDDHDEQETPDVVHFSAQQRRALGIVTGVAAPGRVAVELRLVGEVALDLDRTAHVTSRVAGVVATVERSFGDRVEAGQVLAILDSRDLAEARARLLSARERETLAATTHARERDLRAEEISSERDYLAARQELAEARIRRRAAEQMLHALGVAADGLDGPHLHHDGFDISHYHLTAPISGTVIDRHATLGEMLSVAEPAFVVADLDTVWVDLAAHVQDLVQLRPGQSARVQAIGDGAAAAHEARSQLVYVAPVIDADTRTAIARIALANDGRWRPGLPVTAWITVDSAEAQVSVPAAAVHEIEGRDHVFVVDGDGLRPREVEVGRHGGDRIEVLHGLNAGEQLVTEGAVHVKAAFLTAGVGGHHH
jgi:membrane fusion protein, heavy metal efflux system